MQFVKKGLLGAAVLGVLATGLSAKTKVDDAIAPYSAVSGISGSISSVGSDTLNNLNALWSESFRAEYPNVKIEVEGKGSSTAPPALIAGTSQLGPMSREMKDAEIEKFEKTYGYKPTQIRVALDALSVFVHKDNPVDKMTLEQVDGVFSKTRKSGSKNIANWSDLGGKDGKIHLYGRNSASGTYGFFKEVALFKGDYRGTVKEQPGSASVVQSVARDRAGIGYSGMGYKTSCVKSVALSTGGKYYDANPENVYSGKYPLKRFLYIYINKAPNKPVSPLVREYLSFVLSREGQEICVKDGFISLPASAVDEGLAKLK